MLMRIGSFVLCLLIQLTAITLVFPVSNGYPEERTSRDKGGQIAILSISPSKAEPGMDVILYGSGFTDMTRAFIGNKEIQNTVDGPRQLSFTIPDLAPGLYALFLRREDGARSRVYNFTVLPCTPIIDSLSPDRVFSCGIGSDRQVQIAGRNFQESSQVLFDGAVIKGSVESSESISVTVPQVAGGLHTLQVKNQGGGASSVMALFIDSKPVITGVSTGDEFVNYYNLIIEGKNFKSNSTVVVDGKSMTASSANPFDRERVRYVDCTKIIYERHPYDSEIKSFNVQVIDPNGEESALFQVSAP